MRIPEIGERRGNLGKWTAKMAGVASFLLFRGRAGKSAPRAGRRNDVDWSMESPCLVRVL
jgi:hypothetical protein